MAVYTLKLISTLMSETVKMFYEIRCYRILMKTGAFFFVFETEIWMYKGAGLGVNICLYIIIIHNIITMSETQHTHQQPKETSQIQPL